MKGPCWDGPQVRAVSAGVAPARRRARGAQDRESEGSRWPAKEG